MVTIEYGSATSGEDLPDFASEWGQDEAITDMVKEREEGEEGSVVVVDTSSSSAGGAPLSNH